MGIHGDLRKRKDEMSTTLVTMVSSSPLNPNESSVIEYARDPFGSRPLATRGRTDLEVSKAKILDQGIE